MAYRVEITSCSHDLSMTTGYAEGKLNRREFTASWATYESLGALFYDTWLEATPTQNRAIANALNRIDTVPKLPLQERGSNK
ncbi:MAG: hypothetical protein ACLFVK_06140 [Dehalococcoidia bacterium]